MNLSFAGCGFLGIYHVGVAVCFKKYAPHLLLGKISGASFGAISACALLCDIPIGEITSDVLRIVGEARAGSLGPFSPSFNIQNVLLASMQRHLPPDVHKLVSGRLHISLTRVYDGKNVIVSEFPTREDLLQALLASCFVPVFSGMLPPRFHGVRYMDGGFSDNLPVLDENTVTVSPFCGESDICPRDLSSQLFHVNLANTSIELSKQNINRFARILFPPKPEVLSNMCKQGFDDALRFLHRNNLISCTRCLAVQTTFQLQDVLDDSYEHDPECEECKTHRQDALVDDLPDTVMTIFQNAIDSANSGLASWLLRRRGMRCISLMTLPYRVPVDILYATFTNYIGDKVETHALQYAVMGNVRVRRRRCLRHNNVMTRFVTSTPKMSKSLWRLSWSLLRQLHAFVYSAHDRSDAAARIYYKLALEAKKDTEDYRLDRRFVTSTPKMSKSLWRLSWSLLRQLHAFVYSAHDRSDAAARIYYKLALEAKKDTEDYRLDRRRASEVRVSYGDVVADSDTFEHILNVTAHNDALLAYYYLDSDNKMKMTEIYDVTDADTEAVQSPTERDLNKQLEFDNDWSSDLIANEDELDLDNLDDDLLDRNIFSDPESEWTAQRSYSSSDGDQPESDRRIENFTAFEDN
ncbi:Patatin-like phospholipase domain-containing protein 2 [Papilio machaon]|uniref:triacylglycerol lipase n=1 Tax=Papilio machaon TaxID=76193 RepID=A0A194RFY7_PAPMA|nr:Patatin-like phospholipase domain-containing protein 2 [Papilio machaon]